MPCTLYAARCVVLAVETTVAQRPGVRPEVSDVDDQHAAADFRHPRVHGAAQDAQLFAQGDVLQDKVGPRAQGRPSRTDSQPGRKVGAHTPSPSRLLERVRRVRFAAMAPSPEHSALLQGLPTKGGVQAERELSALSLLLLYQSGSRVGPPSA